LRCKQDFGHQLVSKENNKTASRSAHIKPRPSILINMVWIDVHTS
jgi:hypothetical protein